VRSVDNEGVQKRPDAKKPRPEIAAGLDLTSGRSGTVWSFLVFPKDPGKAAPFPDVWQRTGSKLATGYSVFGDALPYPVSLPSEGALMCTYAQDGIRHRPADHPFRHG
jgi:hypothetical protein